MELLLGNRGTHLTAAEKEPLRQLIERSRVLALKEDVGGIRQVLQQLERARDALSAYLDGRLRSESPAEFGQKQVARSSASDFRLEI